MIPPQWNLVNDNLTVKGSIIYHTFSYTLPTASIKMDELCQGRKKVFNVGFI